MARALPHFPRLKLELEALDAPLVVAWGWVGTGKRRFLAWLRAISGDEVAFVPKAEAKRPLAGRKRVRWLLTEELADRDLQHLLDRLEPHQSLLLVTTRYDPEDVPPGVRSSLIGPQDWRLLPEEAAALAPPGSASTVAAAWPAIVEECDGWYRPLDILSRSAGPDDSRARAELELFLRSEVLAPLDQQERSVLGTLARAAGAMLASEVITGGAGEAAALVSLRDRWGLLSEHLGVYDLPRPLRGHLAQKPVAPRRASTPTAGGEGRAITSPITSPIASPLTAPTTSPMAPEPSAFYVKLLGNPQLFRIEEGERVPLRWSLKRGLRLLALLASSPGLASGREEVIEALWPEASDDEVRRNLHPTVSVLRRLLRIPGGAQPVLLEHGVYRLNPEVDWRIDVLEFERAVLTGRPLEERGERAPDVATWEAAWRLYAGPFLQGHDEAWIESRREELQRLYLDVLRGLGEAYLDEGRLTDSEDAFRSVLTVDPIQETVHLRIMRIYSERGRRDLVRRQYERLCSLLQEELGVEPMPSTAADYHRLMS